MTDTRGRWYVPELHDIHPGSADAFDDMLGLLPIAARRVAAVLLVPRYEGAKPLDRDPRLVDRLTGIGGELVLHGHTHVAPDTPWNRLWYGTRNDAEYARLPTDAARHAIVEGARLVESATGLRPRWFCAPRWRYSSGTTRALHELRWPGWLLQNAIVTLQAGPVGEPHLVSRPSPTIWFDDGERPWRRSAAAWLRGRRLAAILSGNRPFRLAIHPRDVMDQETRHDIRRLLDTLDATGWRPTTVTGASGVHDPDRQAGDGGVPR